MNPFSLMGKNSLLLILSRVSTEFSFLRVNVFISDNVVCKRSVNSRNVHKARNIYGTANNRTVIMLA